MSDSIQKQVLQLQDVEIMNSLGDLKQNPAQLANYISSQKAKLYNQVVQDHSDTFQKTYGDMVRSNDTINNTMYYFVRNKDLDKLQSAVLGNAQEEAEAASFDAQTGKRQVEVNQWTSSNKQDTLFFLQLMLILFTSLALLLYLQRLGGISLPVFTGISTVLSIALILTLVVRAQYTNKTRDNKYWNRRRFQQMGGPPAIPSCESVSGLYNDVVDTVSSVDKQVENQLTNLGNSVGAAVGAFNSPQQAALNAASRSEANPGPETLLAYGHAARAVAGATR